MPELGRWDESDSGSSDELVKGLGRYEDTSGFLGQHVLCSGFHGS